MIIENRAIATYLTQANTDDSLLDEDDHEQIRCCRHPAMAVFVHHCYELQRGLRNLCLHTAPSAHRQAIMNRLEHFGLAYHIVDVSESRINVFFGQAPHIAVVRCFADRPLNLLSPEEDFILGTMLGYDGTQQCERYLKRCHDHFHSTSNSL